MRYFWAAADPATIPAGSVTESEAISVRHGVLDEVITAPAVLYVLKLTSLSELASEYIIHARESPFKLFWHWNN